MSKNNETKKKKNKWNPIEDYYKHGVKQIEHFESEVKKMIPYRDLTYSKMVKDIKEYAKVDDEALKKLEKRLEAITEMFIDTRGKARAITDSWDDWKKYFDPLDEKEKKQQIEDAIIYLLNKEYLDGISGDVKAEAKMRLESAIARKESHRTMSFLTSLANELKDCDAKRNAIDTAPEAVKELYEFYLG